MGDASVLRAAAGRMGDRRKLRSFLRESFEIGDNIGVDWKVVATLDGKDGAMMEESSEEDMLFDFFTCGSMHVTWSPNALFMCMARIFPKTTISKKDEVGRWESVQLCSHSQRNVQTAQGRYKSYIYISRESISALL